MRKLAIGLLSLGLLFTGPQALANTETRKICVFDIIGNAGPIMGAMREWQLAAMEWGIKAELIPFTNEAIAAEDLKAGKCDAAFITGIRGRDFNQYAGTIDSIGGVPTMDHMKRLLQVLVHPSQASKLDNGSFTLLGLAPAGAAYVFVNDRSINTLAKAAGKRVAVLDYDKTQAKLVAQVGATPVASDITNFATRFNNGIVDVIAAPLVAYAPLELYKGLSPNGGIVNYPLVQLSVQLVGRSNRFTADQMTKSRQFFFDNLNLILETIEREEASVDPKWWIQIPADDKREYELMMQEARIMLRDENFYDAEMLTLQRRIRCSVESARPECTDIKE